jgi:hypothetical protein
VAAEHLAERGFTIAKSLNSIFWMTLAFPCASAFMMFALEYFGRKPTAVVAFILTGVFGLIWANAATETMVLAVGFGMIFFTQLAGNSSQIFISEVFPTNARASGFGCAQAAGRIGAAVAIPAILWIYTGWGLNTVFVALAVMVAIAAVAVTQVGPEARGLASTRSRRRPPNVIKQRGKEMSLAQLARHAAALIAILFGAASAVAQTAPSGQPITIGFSMALTGSLAVNGKSGLLAMQIWAENQNAKGGLLGRPVKLDFYDDQTNPSLVPQIYTKLLDVDKVDLVISGYGTNVAAPAMPVVMSHKMNFISLFALDINEEFHYHATSRCFPSAPTRARRFPRVFSTSSRPTKRSWA